MASGLARYEYRIDGGPLITGAPSGTDIRISVPGSTNGYVVVELWVYDWADNLAHDTFWYYLEGGVVKSVQPVLDGRFRVNMARHGFRGAAVPVWETRMAARSFKAEHVSPTMIVIKLKDQRRSS